MVFNDVPGTISMISCIGIDRTSSICRDLLSSIIYLLTSNIGFIDILIDRISANLGRNRMYANLGSEK